MIGAQARWHDICLLIAWRLLAWHQRAVLASSHHVPRLCVQLQRGRVKGCAEGGGKHVLRTSCCAVITFACLVVLGVACIIKRAVMWEGIRNHRQGQR